MRQLGERWKIPEQLGIYIIRDDLVYRACTTSRYPRNAPCA